MQVNQEDTYVRQNVFAVSKNTKCFMSYLLSCLAFLASLKVTLSSNVKKYKCGNKRINTDISSTEAP